MAQASDRWNEQIENLKAQREKKEQGIEYKVESGIYTDREKKKLNESKIENKEAQGIKKMFENNPYVRKITLDELIALSKKIKGEPVRAPEKKTPFISREKEKKAPELSQKGM